MAKTLHRAHARKQAKRLRAIAQARRTLNLKRKGEPLIPTGVLRALAESNLPNDKAAYNARFQELQGSSCFAVRP
jgi:hypothetical protein